MLALIPALVALGLILLTRRAALSLFLATLSGCLLLSSGNPSQALLSFFKDHLFPSLTGTWHLGPIIFTLTLGAFASILEKSGGFQTLIVKTLGNSSAQPSQSTSQKKLLFSIYGLGLLCFFDGLANAILLGRVARPLTDSLRISRQFLAYLIDSTSSAVACVAFISTWIATQLSLIKDGLADSTITTSPASLYFASIPTNAYCLLTLFLIPLVIAKSWHLGPMKQAEAASTSHPLDNNSPLNSQPSGPLSSVLIPLLSLLIALPAFIYFWQDGGWRSGSWQNAFSSNQVPHAMVAAGFLAFFTACLFFPKNRRHELSTHSQQGAASLLPALIILALAWSLGSVFKELGTAQLLSHLLSDQLSLNWLPLAIFLTAALTSFLTGSSWGTMGLLMPLSLPIALDLGSSLDASQIDQLSQALPLTIGAVFGGAVFGDHCSPFSDTTIVSSLASGCSAISHVTTQLPYALITAGFASSYYILVAIGLNLWLSLILCTLCLAFLIIKTQKKGAIAR